jgi:predicted aconitase/predicted aconitase with swiveling domain
MTAIMETTSVIGGWAAGPVLASVVPLSFWGGVDPASGEVIDRHHPLSGRSLRGCILVLPSGRGSCSGSGVLLELLLSGNAPAALVFAETEEILTLGVIVARQIFDVSIPVLRIARHHFGLLSEAPFAWIDAEGIHLEQPEASLAADDRPVVPPNIALTARDHALLDGDHGRAAQAAMQIVVEAASIYSADRLVDVTRAHIDGCIYTGAGGLMFAEKLRDWGGSVAVPTTLNSISVDQRRWRAQGIADAFGAPASRLADAYVEMGARPTFTCAPYLLEDRPGRDEQIVWAESNAVVYANSVLGARTMKYPDYLDICIALTGRAPLAGCHLDEGRRPQMAIDVSGLEIGDDAFYPLLGYYAGQVAGSRIPLIVGLEKAGPDSDDLKAFGAAFATTSAAPMFHIAGVTPEFSDGSSPSDLKDLPLATITVEALAGAWRELNGEDAVDAIGLIALGNPHCSLEELERLATLCEGRRRHSDVKLIVTCGRDIYRRADGKSLIARLEAFGVEFVNDTCWCMIAEPIIPPDVATIMTNSGKYAHYGAGLSGRRMAFGSLAQCVEAAESGLFDSRLPPWLRAPGSSGSL